MLNPASNSITNSALDTPLRNAGAPVNDVVGTGTFADSAAVGAQLIDTTNAKLYKNTGNQASPVGTKVAAEG
jgi:hypothetical protein